MADPQTEQPEIERPTLRCAASKFETLESALSWALTVMDEKFADVESLNFSCYWPLDEDGTANRKMFDAALSGIPK